jgi:hypothetical protein
MRKEAAKQLSRQLASETILRNIVPVLLMLVIAAWSAFSVTNVPVSHRIIEGHFVRWTVFQPCDGCSSLTVVFVDLSDGRTIAAHVGNNWQPPEAGSAVRIKEHSFRWYGKGYSLLP